MFEDFKHKETKYLDLKDVIDLHREILELTGDSPEALRPNNSLGSAINKVKTAAYYRGADLLSQAVILCISISQAQAFIDGNKRTALHCTDVFLRENGYALPPNLFEIIDWLERIAEPTNRDLVIAEFESWLRGIVIKVEI